VQLIKNYLTIWFVFLFCYYNYFFFFYYHILIVQGISLWYFHIMEIQYAYNVFWSNSCLQLLFLILILPSLNNLNGYKYSVFIHAYKLLWSSSPPFHPLLLSFPLLLDPTLTLRFLWETHFRKKNWRGK
jgi:hypothetical protein